MKLTSVCSVGTLDSLENHWAASHLNPVGGCGRSGPSSSVGRGWCWVPRQGGQSSCQTTDSKKVWIKTELQGSKCFLNEFSVFSKVGVTVRIMRVRLCFTGGHHQANLRDKSSGMLGAQSTWVQVALEEALIQQKNTISGMMWRLLDATMCEMNLLDTCLSPSLLLKYPAPPGHPSSSHFCQFVNTWWKDLIGCCKSGGDPQQSRGKQVSSGQACWRDTDWFLQTSLSVKTHCRTLETLVWTPLPTLCPSRWGRTWAPTTTGLSWGSRSITLQGNHPLITRRNILFSTKCLHFFQKIVPDTWSSFLLLCFGSIHTSNYYSKTCVEVNERHTQHTRI